MASPLGSGVTEKKCRKCGMDLAHQPRVKDSHGRYYCKTCYAAALALKRQKAAAVRVRSEPTIEVFEADADISRFDGLLDAGSSAALASTLPCPGCGHGLATDAVICTQCGYDRRTGKRIGPASAPPTEREPATVRRAARPTREGMPAFWQTGWFFGVVSLACFGLLFAGASYSTGLSLLFQAVQIIYSLVITLWIIVLAFQDGAAQGILSFLCGPYLLYYGFAKVESTHLKFGLGVSLLVNVMGAVLGAKTLLAIAARQAGAAS